MIQTGLPYTPELMKDISKQGAIVDMSSINFPEGVENSTRTVFIYLRNTGFKNIVLDFSKCSYEQKQSYLIEYINTDITNELLILTYTWKQILLCRDANVQVYQSILNEEETKEFVRSFEILINDLVSFYLSTPLFILSRIKGEDDNHTLLNMEGIEITDYIPGNENIYYLIEPEFMNALSLTYKDNIPVKFYSQYFNIENNALFDRLTQTDFYALINTMATCKPEEFKEILDEMEKFNEQINESAIKDQ